MKKSRKGNVNWEKSSKNTIFTQKPDYFKVTVVNVLIILVQLKKHIQYKHNAKNYMFVSFVLCVIKVNNSFCFFARKTRFHGKKHPKSNFSPIAKICRFYMHMLEHVGNPIAYTSCCRTNIATFQILASRPPSILQRN